MMADNYVARKAAEAYCTRHGALCEEAGRYVEDVARHVERVCPRCVNGVEPSCL